MKTNKKKSQALCCPYGAGSNCCDLGCTACESNCACVKKNELRQCHMVECKEFCKPKYYFCPEHLKYFKDEENRKMLRIEMYEVGTSSLVKAVGYEPVAKVLRLKLVNNPNHYYDYEGEEGTEGVPPWIYAGLLAAQSMGAYYNRYIKGKQGIPTIIPINEVEPFFTDSETESDLPQIDYEKLVKHLNLTDLATAMCKEFFGYK